MQIVEKSSGYYRFIHVAERPVLKHGPKPDRLKPVTKQMERRSAPFRGPG